MVDIRRVHGRGPPCVPGHKLHEPGDVLVIKGSSSSSSPSLLMWLMMVNDDSYHLLPDDFIILILSCFLNKLTKLAPFLLRNPAPFNHPKLVVHDFLTHSQYHVTQKYHNQMLNGAGIFAYIYLKNGPNVGKYSSTMEHLG